MGKKRDKQHGGQQQKRHAEYDVRGAKMRPGLRSAEVGTDTSAQDAEPAVHIPYAPDATGIACRPPIKSAPVEAGHRSDKH